MLDEYPQEMTDEDSQLGLERLEIESEPDSGNKCRVRIVLAKILGDSDILVKIRLGDEFRYAHRRWGYSKVDGSVDDVDWEPLESPFSFEEAAIFLQEYQFTDHNFIAAKMFGEIIGVPFQHRKL